MDFYLKNAKSFIVIDPKNIYCNGLLSASFNYKENISFIVMMTMLNFNVIIISNLVSFTVDIYKDFSITDYIYTLFLPLEILHHLSFIM